MERVTALISLLAEPPSHACPMTRLKLAEDQLVSTLRRGLHQIPHWERKRSGLMKQRDRSFYIKRFAAGNLAKLLRPPTPSLTFVRDAEGNLVTNPRNIQAIACSALQSFAGDPKFQVNSSMLRGITAAMPKVVDQGVPLLTLDELKRRLKRAPKNKACGPDGLNLFILSRLPDSWLQLYVDSVNHILLHGIIPQRWNRTDITLLYKAGDPLDPLSFRPIMVGTCLYKIISDHIRRHVGQLADQSGLLGAEQQGFRFGMNTARHIWSVASELHIDRDGLLLLVDFRKAFDSVPHLALFELLHFLGFSSQTVGLVQAMYAGVRCFPIVHGDTHVSFELQRGVRQGCSLSPLLFLLYLEPTARLLKLAHPSIPAKLYADDIALWVKTVAAVLAVLATLAQVEFMGLTVNPKKTLAVTNNNALHGTIISAIGPISIAPLREGKYLGVACNSIGKTIDVEQLTPIAPWFASMRGLQLPPRILAYLTNSIILPRLTYRLQYADPGSWKVCDSLIWECFASAAKLPINASLESRHGSPEHGGLALRRAELDCATRVVEQLSLRMSEDTPAFEESLAASILRDCIKIVSAGCGSSKLSIKVGSTSTGRAAGRTVCPPPGWKVIRTLNVGLLLQKDGISPSASGVRYCYTDGSAKDDENSGSAAFYDNYAIVAAWQNGVNSFAAEMLAVMLAVTNCPADLTLHVKTDCESVYKIVQKAMRWGLDRVRTHAAYAIVLVILRTIRERNLVVVISWVKGHAGICGNVTADFLADWARALPLTRWPLWRPKVAVFQHGIPLVGTFPMPIRNTAQRQAFVWVKSAPVHHGAWSWQHGYVTVKPFTAYFNQEHRHCEWCDTVHEPTLFGCLSECAAISDWKALVLSAYPDSWSDTITAWWRSNPPSADKKLVLRYRPPQSLLVQLNITSGDAVIALRRRIPAMAAATSRVYALCRQSV
jgi:ribonuclease HI